MKIFLTLLNIALIGIVIWAVSGFFKTSEDVELSVGRDRTVSTETGARVTTPAPQKISVDEASNLVSRYNLFNISRCPDAVAGRGRASTQQMTLLGVYKIGNTQGAIIQQARQRSGPWNANNANQQQEKSFYQVGEILSNGYTLSAIDNGKVTLTRSGSTMELALESAGRGINTSSQAQPRQPNARQMQQFMMMGQMRMMQQMMQNQNRMLQQQNRQQQQPRTQIQSGNRQTTRR